MSTAGSLYEEHAVIGSFPDSIEAVRPHLRLAEVISPKTLKEKQAAQERIATHFRLQDVEVSSCNRTGLPLEETTSRQMTMIVGKIFSECGGGLEVVGSDEPHSAEDLYYVFRDPNSHGAFLDLLDRFKDSNDIELDLYPIRRTSADKTGYSTNVYQLHTEEMQRLITSIGSGKLPSKIYQIMQYDLDAKYKLADYLIRIRDEEGWTPAL